MASFRIAQWTVHPADGTLTNGESCGRLEPKVMELLAYLATHPGRVISKEELLDAVWPATHVQEVALSRSISEIRRQLGDSARQPTFIETLPKRGYRLMVPVEPIVSAELQLHEEPLVGDLAVKADVTAEVRAASLHRWVLERTRQPHCHCLRGPAQFH
jgi:DNA-binding winged helix-turn-helix (wHTH) protein